MKFLITFAVLAALYCDATGNSENGLPELNISDDLKGQLASGIQNAEELLKDKCRKNSNGEEAYAAAKQAVLDSRECVTKFINVEQLHEEIEEKKKTGDLDVVFGKYCRKKSDLIDCVTNLKKSVEPCLDSEERSTANTIINITNSLADFACYRDGDRIALFIAEGGPECFNTSSQGIKTCLEKELNINVQQENVPVLQSLPQFNFTPERCEKFTKVQECVVKELEKCRETTPGNIAESLFNFIRKRTPCAKKQG